MNKGGYQIVDLGGHNHDIGVGVLHDGIYEKIEGSKCPILLSGIAINDTEFHDTFIFPCVNGSNFVAVVGVNPTTDEQYVINVQDNDVVTFTITKSPN